MNPSRAASRGGARAAAPSAPRHRAPLRRPRPCARGRRRSAHRRPRGPTRGRRPARRPGPRRRPARTRLPRHGDARVRSSTASSIARRPASSPRRRPARRRAGVDHERLHLDEQRPRALEHRRHRRARRAGAPVDEERADASGTSSRPALGHLEQSRARRWRRTGCFVAEQRSAWCGRRRTTAPCRRRARAHAARERALLGDVADQHGRQLALLRLLHQAVRAVAHLRDRARRTGQLGVEDGLDRVEREHVGQHRLDVREHVRERRLGDHEQAGFERPSRSARGRTWAADSSAVTRRQRAPWRRHAAERLEQQRALAHAGLTGEQRDRAGNEPTAEHPVELPDAGGRRGGARSDRHDRRGHRRRPPSGGIDARARPGRPPRPACPRPRRPGTAPASGVSRHRTHHTGRSCALHRAKLRPGCDIDTDASSASAAPAARARWGGAGCGRPDRARAGLPPWPSAPQPALQGLARRCVLCGAPLLHVNLARRRPGSTTFGRGRRRPGRQIHPAPAAGEQRHGGDHRRDRRRSIPPWTPRSPAVGHRTIVPHSRSVARGGRARDGDAAARGGCRPRRNHARGRQAWATRINTRGCRAPTRSPRWRRLAGDARSSPTLRACSPRPSPTDESRTCWSNDAPIAFTSTCWPVRAATSSGSAPMPVWMAARSTSPVTS